MEFTAAMLNLPSSPQQLLRVLHSEQPRFNFCQIEVIFRDDMKVVDLLTQMVLWSLSHIVTSLRLRHGL